mgnify:CR=1 FL=1
MERNRPNNFVAEGTIDMYGQNQGRAPAIMPGAVVNQAGIGAFI